MTQHKKKLRLTYGTLDEDLVSAAQGLLFAAGVISEVRQNQLYDQIVAIHEARKAVRRQGARTRRKETTR